MNSSFSIELDSDLKVEDESPDSQTTGDNSSPPGNDNDRESSNPAKANWAKAKAQCSLQFNQEGEDNNSAEAAKECKHAESEKKNCKRAESATTAKTSNKRKKRLLDSSDKSTQGQEDDHSINNHQDDPFVDASKGDQTDGPTRDTGANAVTQA